MSLVITVQISCHCNITRYFYSDKNVACCVFQLYICDLIDNSLLLGALIVFPGCDDPVLTVRSCTYCTILYLLYDPVLTVRSCTSELAFPPHFSNIVIEVFIAS